MLNSRITLTNHEIKDIMKVISSLENRGILLKETTRKISNQKGGFLNFLDPLLRTRLSSKKNVLKVSNVSNVSKCIKVF